VSRGRAFLWNEQEGHVDLGVLPGAQFSQTLALAGNGAVVVGESGQANDDWTQPHQAFRWTKETGMVGLGFLPGLVRKSNARAVTFDGDLVLGSSGNLQPLNNGATKGFVWDSLHGMRDLEHVIRTEHGLTNLPRNSLEWPRGISDDRKTIVGWTRNVSQGNITRFTAWAIFLDKPLVSFGIPGDFNDDSTVAAADYVVWRNGLGTTYAQTDYDLWRGNFGASAAAGAAAAVQTLSAKQVPEPPAIVLVLLACNGLLWRSRDHARRIRPGRNAELAP
jgi:uncharacterized membrane protein